MGRRTDQRSLNRNARAPVEASAHPCSMKCPCDEARARRNAYSREWMRAKRANLTEQELNRRRESQRHRKWAKRNGVTFEDHRTDPSVCAICKVPVLTHPMKWCR